MSGLSPEFATSIPVGPGEDSQIYLQLLHDLGQALASTHLRAHKWRAWQHLVLLDGYGIESVLPYSTEAIACLWEVYAWDEDDGSTLHHLAIAWHALAWDLELSGDWDRATTAWQEALFFWQRLQACRSFWQEMVSKGRSLRGFDAGVMENARRLLTENLLEVHVEFVRHYYQLRQPQHAARHVQLIRQARLAPAARNRMDDLVYDAMTTSVSSLLASEQYEVALATLDECLRLLPGYPPALTRYLDTAREWISQMSSSDSSTELLNLEKTVAPHWQELKSSQALNKHPLAFTALTDLASTLGSKLWARAHHLLLCQQDDPPALLTPDREEYAVCNRAIDWLEQCRSLSESQTRYDYDLFNALVCRAILTARIAAASKTLEGATQLLDAALTDCHRARDIVPQEPSIERLITEIESLRAQLGG
jgi:tetratricopeptide (TPR) repeat protein